MPAPDMATADRTEAFLTASPAPVTTVPVGAVPDYSFIFVAYGTGPVLIGAITSLATSIPDDVSYEVIVVDNEHPDHPDRAFRRLIVDTHGVRILRPGRNLGFGGGCNLGVAHSTGPVIGLLNPDVDLPRGWLSPLRAELDDGAAIAAPVLVDVDGTTQSAGHELLTDAFTAPVVDAPAAGQTSRPDFASAACWLMQRVTYEELGGFDASFFPAYYEDVDLALRARTAGGTTVVGGVRVTHHRGGSTTTAAEPDTTPQRLRLLTKWPEFAVADAGRSD